MRRLLSRSRTRVRPLHVGEEDLVRHLLEGLSEHSRRLRFHRLMPRISDDLVRQLARLDAGRVVLVAERRTRDGWQPVGLGHLSPDDPGVAELAVAVLDAHQGQGVGRQLVAALVEAARDSTHERVVALVLAGNDPMLHLLRRELPMARTRHGSDGVLHLEAGLGAWTLSTDDVLGDLMQAV